MHPLIPIEAGSGHAAPCYTSGKARRKYLTGAAGPIISLAELGHPIQPILSGHVSAK
jgi:hypothetical protein